MTPDISTASAKAITGDAIETKRAATVLSATFAILLGAFFIFGAGFAQIDAVHNAAHDVRHAFAFPCH